MADTQLALPGQGRLRGLADRLGIRNAMLAVAIFVVLPNVLFLLVSPWFLIRRVLSPLVYVLAAIPAVLLPAPFGILAFFLAAALDVFFIILFIFDMPPATTLHSIWYLADIDVTASALYGAMIAYFLILPAGMFFLTRRYRAELRSATLVPALLLAFGAGFFDYSINGFKPIAQPPFESAMAQNGLTAETIAARGRNFLIVIVEGLGAYRDPAEREILAGRLRRAAEGRFGFSHGVSNHYGSTTGAESRELCGQWGTYTDLLARPGDHCLPAQLTKAGYTTASYHASYGSLFSRPQWYPKIGFQQLNFREDIERERPQAISRLCGTVVAGLCDGEIGEIVHRDMLAAGEKPHLFYWLTLNSHIPFEPRADAPLKCRTAEAAIDAQMPCELTEIWMDVFDKVAEIAADPKTPPVDILVVGDHNTPMWTRSAFGHFIPGKVDWYFLEDRRGVTPPA